MPYFTAVFVLSNGVEHKFISPTDGFRAVGLLCSIHMSVDFNTVAFNASKILLY